LKVAEIEQLPPATMLDPHVFALMLNTWPDVSCTELIVRAAVPELVSAKLSAALLVLTAW
jgi:hypothetical protein